MRPFILTDLQAGKLPRLALIVLCLLYALPGLIGRDPWRVADAADFGVALTMVRGDLNDWLLPNLVGLPIHHEGPLAYWLYALPARIVWFAPAHVVVCLAAAMLLGLSFVAFWYGAYSLARRHGVQPDDPFGASASQVDYGRAVADSALLILLASFGLLIRMHETTVAASQVLWVSVFLFGTAIAIDNPRRGGLIAGLAIAALGMTRDPAYAVALLLSLLTLCTVSQPFRLVARSLLLHALLCALGLLVLWPALLWLAGGDYRRYLLAWLAVGTNAYGVPTKTVLLYLVRTSPWFFWPAWPIALWAAYRWRSRLSEPAVALPLCALASLSLLALLSPRADELMLLPIAPPLALLAAMGLPTLKRGVVSLIDWFAVTTFTLFGIAVWAYWIALMTGTPAKMAVRAVALAGGSRPAFTTIEFVFGVLASLAWLWLVKWRISRQPRMVWRAVALSSAGLVLAWFLLMTLWLPVFDQRNTYRELSMRVAKALPPDYGCINSKSLEPAERASLAYFGSIRFAEQAPTFESTACNYLLVQDDGPIAQSIRPGEPGWDYLWEGRRKNDPSQRMRLYRRQMR